MPFTELVPRARALGITYPLLLGTREMQARFRVSQLPTTYVVGSDGRLVTGAVGGVTDAWLRDAISNARDR